MSILSLRTRRRRENWAGLPVDADPILGCVSPSMSLAPGLDLEGSRTVASSTPVRISVPSTDAPWQPFHVGRVVGPGRTDKFAGIRWEDAVGVGEGGRGGT